MEITKKFKSTYIETEYDGLFVEVLEYLERIEDEPGEFITCKMQDIYTFHTSSIEKKEFWYSTAEKTMNGLLADIDDRIETRVYNAYPFLRRKRRIV